jgi:polyketide synthase 12
MSREHIRYLLGEISLGAADLDVLATQLTAALDGPLLLYLSSAILSQAPSQVSDRLGRGWEDLIQRVCRSPSEPEQRRTKKEGGRTAR